MEEKSDTSIIGKRSLIGRRENALVWNIRPGFSPPIFPLRPIGANTLKNHNWKNGITQEGTFIETPYRTINRLGNTFSASI